MAARTAARTKSRKSASRKRTAAKPAEKRRPAAKVLDSLRRRTQVLSVFGASKSRTLLEVPTELAEEMLRRPLEQSGQTNMVEVVERTLAEIRQKAPDVADSPRAAMALRLAYELEHPFTPATARANCSRAMLDVLDQLREMVPIKEEGDRVAKVSARRKARRGESA